MLIGGNAIHNNDEDDLALAIQLSLRQMEEAGVPVDNVNNEVDHHDDRDNGGMDVQQNGVDETDNGTTDHHPHDNQDIDQVFI